MSALVFRTLSVWKGQPQVTGLSQLSEGSVRSGVLAILGTIGSVLFPSLFCASIMTGGFTLNVHQGTRGAFCPNSRTPMSVTDALIASAGHIQAVKYVTVASLAILVYDYLLTLDREIRFIWKTKWGFGKVLFLLARYPTFVDVPMTVYHTLVGYHGVIPSPRKCLIIYTITTWSTVFGIAMAEAILTLRTYALYHGSRKILIFLVIFYGMHLIADVTIAELYVRSLQFGEAPDGIRELGGCHAVEGSKIIFIDFCNIIFQETVILSLTLYKGIKTFRRSSSQMLRTFYRDGVFYYVYIFLISAGNIIVLVTGPVDLLDLLDTFQRVMHSVLATRILLHVREALQNEYETRTTLSDPKFAQPKEAGARARFPYSSAGDTSTGFSTGFDESTLPTHPDS